MAAIRTYGIPNVIEAQEIFKFNKGVGTLKIRFRNGIVDPKYDIPATYSTASEFEQLVIEHSIQFGRKVFRYGQNGNIMPSIPVEPEADNEPVVVKKGKNQRTVASVDDTKEYPLVESLGDATEVLMELGVNASDLGGKEAILSAMVQKKVSFPNLKVK